MAIRIYDTLTRQLQELPLPTQQPELKMYVCGPTVYDDPHIGHARSAYVFDVIRRYLEYRGYKVMFVRNVTDVDDKIIQKANQTGQTTEQVAGHYLETYHAAMSQLGILPPTKEPKATEHIPQMQQLIKALVRKGSAYGAANGDVYFAVRAFNGYGKLSNRSVDELESGARVESGEEKRDPLDFALWKAAKPGEPQWSDQAPNEQPALVPGRPGWHIECSAMSMQYLGETFDIHSGGVDLVFPHHENEVAQSQAFTGKSDSFAKFWIHNGLLTINGQKMSKSLGNFITVAKALEEAGGEEAVLKFFFLGALYRSPIDYSQSRLEEIKTHLGRFRSFEGGLAWERKHHPPPPNGHGSESVRLMVLAWLSEMKENFQREMDSDFNTPEALGVLDELVRQGNRWLDQGEGSEAERVWMAEECAKQIRELAEILGIEGDDLFASEGADRVVHQLMAEIDNREQVQNRIITPLHTLIEVLQQCGGALGEVGRVDLGWEEVSQQLLQSWVGEWAYVGRWSDAHVYSLWMESDERERERKLSEAVEIAVNARKRLRDDKKHRRYDLADEIRKAIDPLAQLEDTREGARIKLRLK